MLDRLSKRALAPENRRQRAWRAGRQPPHPWGLSVPPGPVCRPARSQRPLFCSAEKADWGQGLRTPRSSSHFGVCSPCPHLRWLWSLCREVPLEGCSLSPPPPRAAPFGPTAPGMKRPQLRASCAPRGQPTPPRLHAHPRVHLTRRLLCPRSSALLAPGPSDRPPHSPACMAPAAPFCRCHPPVLRPLWVEGLLPLCAVLEARPPRPHHS